MDFILNPYHVLSLHLGNIQGQIRKINQDLTSDFSSTAKIIWRKMYTITIKTCTLTHLYMHYHYPENEQKCLDR